MDGLEHWEHNATDRLVLVEPEWGAVHFIQQFKYVQLNLFIYMLVGPGDEWIFRNEANAACINDNIIITHLSVSLFDYRNNTSPVCVCVTILQSTSWVHVFSSLHQMIALFCFPECT